MMNPVLVSFWLCAMSAIQLSAATEACNGCSRRVEVSGRFAHIKTDSMPSVQAAKPGAEAAFREEIAGPEFAVTISELPAGKYTIIIGAAEARATGASQRLFDITLGDKTAAANLDLFAAAGGAHKALYLTNEVEHQEDSLRGPLTIKFIGRKGDAKFSCIEIKDAAGVSIVETAAAELADPFAAAATTPPNVTGPEVWKDASQPMAARIKDLISRMSLAEKVEQMKNGAPAIPRLGLPAYDYWNEALHGVGRANIATVFPQAIGMAATWDTTLVQSEGDIISTEGRAKCNDYAASHNGNILQYYGLTYWSPNINLFRDPRWGRGQETYGEDTFLAGSIGVAFIRGVQGTDPNYYKAIACAKHFAVHSGPESSRHRFDAQPSERDFYENYLPHFEMAVREGHVGGFMGAYNSVYGAPSCASPLLLTQLLRGQWGFDGYVVSDCGAINDIRANHHFVSTPEEAAAAAVKAGCDLCCGGDYTALVRAVQKGLITKTELDGALSHTLATRFRLGLFDPPAKVPFSKISIAENDTPQHEALALQAARESLVLLKNDGLLPLDPKKTTRILVVGANATSVPMLWGNYNGTPARPVTILEGIKAIAGATAEVRYELGCPLAITKKDTKKSYEDEQRRAVEAAKASDVVVYAGGISAAFEGEEGDALASEGFSNGDRTRIELPAIQENLLKALQASGTPVVYVNCSGSAIAMPWEAENLPAILQAWYPGEQGGNAVAEVLFGKVNPAGRLPITFYRATADLPAFDDYSLSNRTYRYFNGKPLFAFGHGLSYTKFDYSKARLNKSAITESAPVKLTFTVKNAGKLDGDEVAQVYFRHLNSAVPQPQLALCGFQRIHIARHQKMEVTIEIPSERLRYWDTAAKRYTVEPGQYELLIGGASDDIRLRAPFTVQAK